MELVEMDLFGGAMTARLPHDSKDVSTLREVPDNQEVFIHSDTPQSIVIEILEYVQGTGEQSIRIHFEDLADSNDVTSDSAKILTVEEIPSSKLSMSQCDSAWFLHGEQNISKYKEGDDAKNVVTIYMAVFRLVQFTADILVTLNDPTFISSSSSDLTDIPTSAQRWNMEHFQGILTSLKISDTGLFG